MLGSETEWQPRLLFAVKRNQVSARNRRFRLDAQGRLFDIAADPGQRTDVSHEHQELTCTLRLRALEVKGKRVIDVHSLELNLR